MNILSKRLFVTIFCTSFTPQVLAPGGTEDYEPCADDYMVTYLNRDDVKKAVHAESSIEWMECATQLHYNMADRLIPMQPIYLELLKSDAGLNILVYSGDDDAVCGTIGTQEWIWGLGYSPVSKEETWKTWSYADQVAGYATKFNIDTGKDNSLAFVTVHKAGHEVPTYVPEQALDLFQKYLDGYWKP
jgi:carboxypeptidase C (cathepsin A)